MMVGRIMALDPGEKRMGVAMSDEMGLIAQPLETHACGSAEEVVAHVRSLVEAHGVTEVVVGLPIRLNGEPGRAAERVRGFIERLEEVLEVPVVPWDERLTSKAAERMLIQANVSRSKRKGAVDRVAAAVLLQSYLDRRARNDPEMDASNPDWPELDGDQEAANTKG